MRRLIGLALAIFLITSGAHAQRYSASDGRLRVALAKQPFSPTGISVGPNTDEGGLSLAAVNRMIAGAIRGMKARESKR